MLENNEVRPFDGIRVIDVTHVLAGPFATYQLALLGADVIKVEHPDEPDQSRGTGTDKALNRAGLGTSFLAQASNKRAITLDLKTEAGREALKRLVATADVFVENYRPGALDALGLGYAHLSAINPRLIYASFSAFGDSGPHRERTAYDHVIQATSGIMAMTGTKDVNPVMFGAPAIDYATGTTGAFALSAALFQRERTGRGQKIDMAMLDVAMILMSSHLAGYLRNGTHPKPHGNRHAHATNGAYETKDGLLMVGASNLRQQRRLWTVLGRPDLIKRSNDEREADHARETEVLVGNPQDPHGGGVGGVLPGPPRAGGAGAHHGRGGRPSADGEPRRDPSPRRRAGHCRRVRRSRRRFQVRPWRPAGRYAAAGARGAQCGDFRRARPRAAKGFVRRAARHGATLCATSAPSGRSCARSAKPPKMNATCGN